MLRPAVLHTLHMKHSDTGLHVVGLLSNQSSREVSVQHPLSFIPLLSPLLCPTLLPCVPPLVSIPQTRKSAHLTSLSGSLSTQAENVIAGRPAKHEMSGGSRLLYNPFIFKKDGSLVEYSSFSNLYKYFFWLGWLKIKKH